MDFSLVEQATDLETYWPYALRAAKFALGFLVVYALGYLVAVPAVVRVVRRRNRNNPTVREAIERYVTALVVVVALGVAVAAGGYGRLLTSSALVVAAGTLAIGVAGQAVLGAVISGLFLVGDPNFNVGDWIAWSDKEGVVESITLRVTRVRTSNNEVITVPNTELTTNAITRPFGREQFRVTERIGIEYDDDVDAAMDVLRRAVADHGAVLSDPPPRVYLEELGGDAVVLRTDFWIRNPTQRDLLSVRSGVARGVKERFDAAGFGINPPSHHDVRGRVAVDRETVDPES